MSFVRTTLAAAVTAAALLPAFGHAQQYKNEGYLVDQNSNIVTSSNTGLCWHTGVWTPALAVEQCDPDLVKKAQPPAREKPAPAAPTAKPPAAPVEQKAAPKPPAKPLPQKINFSADALFDFNKADLKPKGKTMLDDLVGVLNGASYEVILAIGHTDRIGSVQYNQKLSVKRAESVKQYLIGKGIAANRVYAEGKGKSQPVTKPGDCRMKNRTALIACLQPDRRVDVEVTGTR
jgi:OOP family OmpA-OmpF porin